MSGLPESQRQAERWDATRDNYAAFGLCDRCAAQAAYGHADGFGNAKRPCAKCTTIMAALPVPRINGWRSFRRGDSARQTWPSTPLSGNISPAAA